METTLEVGRTLDGWLSDPLIGKAVVLLVGVLAILLATALVRRAVTRYVHDGSMRYRARKLVGVVEYGSDYHEARSIIERVAEEVSGAYARAAEEAWAPIKWRYAVEAASVAPAVTMHANENWIEFTLRYVVDFKRRCSTKDRLFTRILEEIDRSGERVGIAAAALNIEKLAPLEVHLARAGAAGGGSGGAG